ncbi:unnamed protein product [Sphagnum jensenii]|uniref:Uncharacterized protein n=1 Tax=Sphagnum jensenii TaxID=128206 RepID=A0ABP0XEC1_9BRYO
MQGAEERLQGLLDKQENIQAHFQEELEKGDMDRQRELLKMEMIQKKQMSQIMTVAQSRLVALQHDETQRTPMVGTKQHLIAKDNACVFENSPEVAEEKSTHCHKKVIEMQQDKCQELGLLETNTFLAITAMLQDNEKDILDFFPFDEAAITEIENSSLATKLASNMVANEYMSRSESGKMITKPSADMTRDQRPSSQCMELRVEENEELSRVSKSTLDKNEMEYSELAILISKELMESTKDARLYGGAGKIEGHLGVYTPDDDAIAHNYKEIVSRDEEAKKVENLKNDKAEMRILVHEQEVAWRMAEDALENMNQRLRQLEGRKVRLHETLIRKLHIDRSQKNMEAVLNQLETQQDDDPQRFTSFYKSPLSEDDGEGAKVASSHVTRGHLSLMIMPGHSNESQVTILEESIKAQSEKLDDMQDDRGQQKSVYDPQKSMSLSFNKEVGEPRFCFDKESVMRFLAEEHKSEKLEQTHTISRHKRSSGAMSSSQNLKETELRSNGKHVDSSWSWLAKISNNLCYCVQPIESPKDEFDGPENSHESSSEINKEKQVKEADQSWLLSMTKQINNWSLWTIIGHKKPSERFFSPAEEEGLLQLLAKARGNSSNGMSSSFQEGIKNKFGDAFEDIQQDALTKNEPGVQQRKQRSQKSPSTKLDGGSNRGPENNVMSPEAPDDLPDDKIGQEDKSWINDGKGNQVLRSSGFPGQWGSIPLNLKQEKRSQKAQHHHSNNKQKESEIVSKFQPQETLKGSNERMNIGSKSNRRSRDVEDMMGHHPKGEDHAKNVVPNWRSSVYHEPPPPPLPSDTSKATISFAALSLKESSIQKRAMERKGRNKLKQERAMAIATVERKLGLMQT